MGIEECDDRGRLLLRKDIREAYGDKFYVVKAPKEVILIPVPKDPIKDLAELGKASGLDKYSVKQLKKMAREDAEKEALAGVKNALRRH